MITRRHLIIQWHVLIKWHVRIKRHLIIRMDGASAPQALVSMTMSSDNLANLIDPLTDPKYQDQDGRFEKIFATPSDQVTRAVLEFYMVDSGDKKLKHKRRKVKRALRKLYMVESNDKNIKHRRNNVKHVVL